MEQMCPTSSRKAILPFYSLCAKTLQVPAALTSISDVGEQWVSSETMCSVGKKWEKVTATFSLKNNRFATPPASP
jgi:hypothetical protein